MLSTLLWTFQASVGTEFQGLDTNRPSLCPKKDHKSSRMIPDLMHEHPLFCQASRWQLADVPNYMGPAGLEMILVCVYILTLNFMGSLH